MTALARLRRDLARADRLQHTVAVVGREHLREVLAGVPRASPPRCFGSGACPGFPLQTDGSCPCVSPEAGNHSEETAVLASNDEEGRHPNAE